MIPRIETSNKYSSVPNLLNRLDKMNGNLYKLPVLTTKNSIRIQEKFDNFYGTGFSEVTS